MDMVTGRIDGMRMLLARRRSPSDNQPPHTSMTAFTAQDVSA
jgi:hypothetical protein